MTQSNVRAAFERHFNTHGTLYASAGRINLIGEHTDYNGGFVFPGAVDCGITAMIRPNGTDRVRAYAVDLDSYAEFGLREEDKPSESWARYIFGVCREIQKRGGRIGGFDTAFSGDVPLGAGMSSSAALESTFAFALNDLYALGIDKFELARIGQSTEHNYCGVKCGIMDQFASVFGKKGCLMRLDCRSMEFEYFPFDPVGYKLVLLDTVVKHELVGSPYNRRRESCERVAKMLEEADVRGVSLGYDDDVSMGSFLSYNGGNAGALMLDSLGAQLFSNLHQVRVEGIPEHFYTVYMAYHKKHVHSRAVADFIDFVKAYPGNDLIGQVLPTAPAE